MADALNRFLDELFDLLANLTDMFGG